MRATAIDFAKSESRNDMSTIIELQNIGDQLWENPRPRSRLTQASSEEAAIAPEAHSVDQNRRRRRIWQTSMKSHQRLFPIR